MADDLGATLCHVPVERGSSSSSPVNSDGLCISCAKVDLATLFSGPRYPERHFEKLRVFLSNLYHLLNNDTCSLCRLVKFAITETDYRSAMAGLQEEDIDVFLEPWRADVADGPILVEEAAQTRTATSLAFHLQSTKGPNHDLEHFHPNDIKLLYPDSFIKGRPLFNGRPASTIKADLSLAKKWISSCERHHSLCLNPSSRASDSYRKTFQLIAVESRSVIKADPIHSRYAALSYVWGYTPNDYSAFQDSQRERAGASLNVHHEPLPERLPRSIEDSLQVCKSLGLRYLWVDLFCIDQTGSETKQIQIENMGNTYRNATVTLVAAIGKDSEAGLPGVRNYEGMCGQHVETIKEQKYITGLPTLEDQVRDGRWAERGWTFQEGLLSSRCLIFGGYDVSFLCRSGHWRESLNSVEELYRDNGMPISLATEEIEHYPLATHTLTSDLWNFGDYVEIVKAYTLRDLSRESDVIHAIEGYLGMINNYTGVQFLSGLPVVNLAHGLLWKGLWSEQRSGFPTWSWTGWSGGYRYWPFFENVSVPVRTGEEALDGPENARAPGLQRRLVTLYGDDYPEPCFKNHIIQKLADIAPESNGWLCVESFIARISLIPLSDPDGDKSGEAEGFPARDPTLPPRYPPVPVTIDPQEIYETPRMTIVDRHGSPLKEYRNDFQLSLPHWTEGKTLNWILNSPFHEFLMIARWEEEWGPHEYTNFNYVSALLIQREGEFAVRAGSMLVPIDDWDIVSPTLEKVYLV
jgi:hypothetical protein